MKTNQIQLRRILLVIETSRCYEYKGEYYEHLGGVAVKNETTGVWIGHERYRLIGADFREYARDSISFSRRFKKVKDHQKVMQEFGAIYQPIKSIEKAENNCE